MVAVSTTEVNRSGGQRGVMGQQENGENGSQKPQGGGRVERVGGRAEGTGGREMKGQPGCRETHGAIWVTALV